MHICLAAFRPYVPSVRETGRLAFGRWASQWVSSPETPHVSRSETYNGATSLLRRLRSELQALEKLPGRRLDLNAQACYYPYRRWDSISRKWSDNQHLMNLVSLFLLDEVHMLGEEKRGATLEAVVGRMKARSILNAASGGGHATGEVRFVAVSATVPNVADIAKWLVDGSGMETQNLKKNESWGCK